MKIIEEIDINRKKLQPFVDSTLEHFCYPSGIYNTEMQDYLRKSEVVTGTLCDIGLVTSDSNMYELNRILDGQLISQLEFEGEVSGFLELVRQTRKKIKCFFA